MLGTMSYDDFEWVSTTGDKLPPGKRAFAKVGPPEVASSLHLLLMQAVFAAYAQKHPAQEAVAQPAQNSGLHNVY